MAPFESAAAAQSEQSPEVNQNAWQVLKDLSKAHGEVSPEKSDSLDVLRQLRDLRTRTSTLDDTVVRPAERTVPVEKTLAMLDRLGDDLAKAEMLRKYELAKEEMLRKQAEASQAEVLASIKEALSLVKAQLLSGETEVNVTPPKNASYDDVDWELENRTPANLFNPDKYRL